MKEIVLKSRKPNPPEVFKAIRIAGNVPDRFTGYFRYIRVYYKGYDYKKGDVLDQQILSSIQSIYPESSLSMNILMLLDKQYDDCLKITKGGTHKEVLTYFNPMVQYNYGVEIPENIRAYYKSFNLMLWLNAKDKRLALVIDSLHVNIPQGDLKELIKTIKSV